MPLDPKYSNLPYIATDQPDVYESGDLPESDQQRDNESQQEASTDPSVQHTRIDHAAAAAKFSGKSLNADDVDFTDAVRAGRRVGYSLRRRDFEIVADGDSETVLQRYQRLQAELHDLASVVDEAKTSANVDKDTTTPDQLAALVRGLQQELSSMHLDSLLGSAASSADGAQQQQQQLEVFNPESCIEKRLLAEVEKLKLAKAATDASAAGASADARVYEIYAAPPAAGSSSSSTADLESRLAKLEAAIGKQHLKSPALSADLAGRSLWDATHKLTARLSLLDPSSLDQIDSRLAALNHRLQQVTGDKRELLSDADTQARVAELYQLVKKWDASADCVQSVVSRLESLKQLHEQAMQFSGALSCIDQSQRSSAAQVQAVHTMLSALQERVVQDLATVESNVKCLQERMKAVK